MNEDPRATSIEQPSAGLASRGASSTGRLLITKSTRGILGRVRNASTLVMVIVCWVGLSLSNPYFFTALNVSNIFSHSANIALIAMGLTIVLVAGEIDLSVGSVEALGAALPALLIVNGHLPVALAICATVGAGILAGSVSGLIRVLFRVPSFVTTLGMLSVASGIALVITNGNPVYGLPSSFTGRSQVVSATTCENPGDRNQEDVGGDPFDEGAEAAGAPAEGEGAASR